MGKKKKKKKWNGRGRPPRGAPPESSEADLKALYGEGYESPAPGELDVARSQRAGVARKRRLDRMRRAAASDRAIPARAVTTEAWSDLESEEIAAALAASEAEAQVRSSPPGSVTAPTTPRRPPPPPEARASPEAGSGDGADVLAALQGGHPPQKRKYKTGRTQDRTKEWEDHKLFGRDEFTAEAFEEIKRELSESGNGWTKGNAWRDKSGTKNYIMEWCCEFKDTLSCPCVFRVEHVRAQYGVTVIRKRMGHAHLFKPKFKDSRFPWSVLDCEISEDRRICCDWHDRHARIPGWSESRR